MPTQTAPIRNKTRRVKDHILNRYLGLADRVTEKGEENLSQKELERYWELTLGGEKETMVALRGIEPRFSG